MIAERAPTLAGRFWEALEPIHAVVYFAPESVDAASRVGLSDYWMSYFAGRFAPLGAVSAAPVVAMAYGFAPSMVARSIPEAWTLAEPSAVLDARLQGASTSLSKNLDATWLMDIGELEGFLWDAVGSCRFDGRPLAAAWSSVARPDDPVASTWLATTILREHRSDGHVLAAVPAGMNGLEATLTLVATHVITRDVIQPNRGWSDDEWDDAAARLHERGILDSVGELTATGDRLRRAIEDTTDQLAAAPLELLGDTYVEHVINLATPVSRRLIDSGMIPVPDPIGGPRS
ncbi:MAG TPA: hypothetical protein VGZ68_05040 [Acidimicrobiales bacterium]|nr:hypothetical protein [Acidimicrobiales bacterium]